MYSWAEVDALLPALEGLGVTSVFLIFNDEAWQDGVKLNAVAMSPLLTLYIHVSRTRALSF